MAHRLSGDLPGVTLVRERAPGSVAMIPLRDTIPHRGPPVMTWAVIAINVAIFGFQTPLSAPQLELYYQRVGIVPARFLQHFGGAEVLTLLTSMFVHGGWFHILGNMWSLWIFGDNVEDRMGHGMFVFFYLGCGAAAAALHIALSPSSVVPTIGASGAIAGVMGAYLVLFPHSRVIALIPIVFFIQIIEVPAYFFLVLWFALQLVSGLASLSSREASLAHGVAWWAHIGGFAAGMALARRWVRSLPRGRQVAKEIFPW
jgi:membrane associated rhomboid family serine protease